MIIIGQKDKAKRLNRMIQIRAMILLFGLNMPVGPLTLVPAAFF